MLVVPPLSRKWLYTMEPNSWPNSFIDPNVSLAAGTPNFNADAVDASPETHFFLNPTCQNWSVNTLRDDEVQNVQQIPEFGNTYYQVPISHTFKPAEHAFQYVPDADAGNISRWS